VYAAALTICQLSRRIGEHAARDAFDTRKGC